MERLPLPALFLIVEFSNVSTILVLCQTNKNHIRKTCLEAVSSAINKNRFSILLPTTNFFSQPKNSSFWFHLCVNHFETTFNCSALSAKNYEDDSSKSKMDFLGFSIKVADPK